MGRRALAPKGHPSWTTSARVPSKTCDQALTAAPGTLALRTKRVLRTNVVYIPRMEARLWPRGSGLRHTPEAPPALPTALARRGRGAPQRYAPPLPRAVCAGACVARTCVLRGCSFEEVSREVAAMRAKAQSASSQEEKMFWQRHAMALDRTRTGR